MKWLKTLFRFAGTDRRVLPLALVVLLVTVAWLAYRAGVSSTNGGSSQPVAMAQSNANTASADNAAALRADASSGNVGAIADDAALTQRTPERFVFDPNTADSTQLLRLGLTRWQVRSIYHYRAKGGTYHRPTDFARLYGLTVKQYRELEPYIRIGADYRLAADVYAQERGGYGQNRGAYGQGRTAQPSGNAAAAHPRDSIKYPVKLKAGEHIALNTADTTLLKRVPGIGSYYARRVVAYRKQLGGFHSAQQLLEIEGFPPSALAFFTPDAHGVTKLNVNKLSLDQLRRHPYITYYQARDIVDYRRMRGPITHLDQLRLMKDFSEADLQRLAPYIAY